MNTENNNKKCIKILHLEDSPHDAEIIRERLMDSGFSLHLDWVTSEQEFSAFLQSGGYDLVLVDYLLPSFDGMAALRLTQSFCPGVPFICVSGAIGEERAVELLKLGATDFVPKSRLEKLPLAMQRALDEVEERAARRQAEEALEQLNASLEARVVEMVTDLRRKDQILIQQSRLAAMGEIICTIAHHWRQPLNNIGLIIQSIQLDYNSGTLTPEEMDSSINDLLGELLKMSHTIDDFNNSFQKDTEKQLFFLNKVVNRALSLVSPILSSHNIQVEIEAGDEVTAIGNENEYLQVLLNIITNAREAGIEHNITTPRIFIRIARENERSVLYIRDNCGGIPEDIVPKIFDPYFSTRGPASGTGLGLYISKVIIEQNMAGHLTAGNVGDGAEFRIEV